MFCVSQLFGRPKKSSEIWDDIYGCAPVQIQKILDEQLSYSFGSETGGQDCTSEFLRPCVAHIALLSSLFEKGGGGVDNVLHPAVIVRPPGEDGQHPPLLVDNGVGCAGG